MRVKRTFIVTDENNRMIKAYWLSNGDYVREDYNGGISPLSKSEFNAMKQNYLNGQHLHPSLNGQIGGRYHKYAIV